MEAGRCVSVQGVHLQTKAGVFGHLVLVTPILGLHIDLDQLEEEAYAGGNIGVISVVSSSSCLD